MNTSTRTHRIRSQAVAIFSFAIAIAMQPGCGGDDSLSPDSVDDYAADVHELRDGTTLWSEQHRTGVYQIATYDGSSLVGSCTATILRSSESLRQTWLVTAAHCFSYHDNLYYVWGHYANPRARVYYGKVRVNADGSPTSQVDYSYSERDRSTVFVHPEWLASGGHSSWFGPKDVAFIRVDDTLPVYDEDNYQNTEYRRPIFTGDPTRISAPYAASSPASEYAFCGQSDGWLRCDQLTNLWYSPNFRYQFLQIPVGAWTGGFYAPGDSGGPLLYNALGFVDSWQGGLGDGNIARHGIVLGVLQGPTVWCDYVQNPNCNPSDALVAHFNGIETFLATIPGSNAIPRLSVADFEVPGAPPVGDPVGVAAGADQHVVYRDAAGHIHHSLLTSAMSSQPSTDVTAITHAPVAVGDPTEYVLGDSLHIVYRGAWGQLYELYASSTSSWAVSNLTQATHAPVAQGDPSGYVFGDSQHVVYRGASGQIFELYWTLGYGWGVANLTAATNAPYAQGEPAGYAFGDSQHVMYRGASGQIFDLYWTLGYGWSVANLTQATNAPPAFGDPCAYLAGNSLHVVYRTSWGEIDELYWTGSWWGRSNLTAATNAPSAVGAPFGYAVGDSQHVVYRDAAGNVRELYWAPNRPWGVGNLTTQSIGVPSVGNPIGYVVGNTQHVLYPGEDNALHVLVW